MIKKYDLYIGIDTGVNTGFAIWDPKEKKFHCVKSMKIHKAMQLVRDYRFNNILVRVEDARQRKWFGKNATEKLQGAGSVKRDAGIWEDFLTDLVEVDFEMVPPKNNSTKLKSAYFKKLTKWPDETNEHARDAAMLVFGK